MDLPIKDVVDGALPWNPRAIGFGFAIWARRDTHDARDRRVAALVLICI